MLDSRFESGVESCPPLRMRDERMAKRVYESDVRGVRRGRPRKFWMDGVKELLARKGLNIQEAKVNVQDRNDWRSICKGCDMPLVRLQQDVLYKWPGGWLWKLRFC